MREKAVARHSRSTVTHSRGCRSCWRSAPLDFCSSRTNPPPPRHLSTTYCTDFTDLSQSPQPRHLSANNTKFVLDIRWAGCLHFGRRGGNWKGDHLSGNVWVLTKRLGNVDGEILPGETACCCSKPPCIASFKDFAAYESIVDILH